MPDWGIAHEASGPSPRRCATTGAFGSIAVRKFDPVTVQALMGHSSLSTTERYMHSRPRADARLAAAFASDSEIQPGLTRTKPKRDSRSGSKFKLTTKIKR